MSEVFINIENIIFGINSDNFSINTGALKEIIQENQYLTDYVKCVIKNYSKFRPKGIDLINNLVNFINKNFDTSLQLIESEEFLNLEKYIIDDNIDLLKENFYHRSNTTINHYLELAVQYGSIYAFKYLISKDPQSDYEHLLIEAAKSGNIEIMMILRDIVMKRAPPNKREQTLKNAIYNCFIAHYNKIANEFMEKCNLKLTDIFEDITEACIYTNMELFNDLRKLGVSTEDPYKLGEFMSKCEPLYKYFKILFPYITLKNCRIFSLNELNYSLNYMITHITFKSTYIKDLDITAFKFLEKIQINYCKLEEISINDEMSYLKVVDLSFNKLKKFSKLFLLPQLISLDLSNNQIADFQKSELAKLEHLIHFNIQNNKITQSLLTELQSLKHDNRKIISIYNLENIEEEVEQCILNYDMDKLQNICISNNDYIDIISNIIITFGLRRPKFLMNSIKLYLNNMEFLKLDIHNQYHKFFAKIIEQTITQCIADQETDLIACNYDNLYFYKSIFPTFYQYEQIFIAIFYDDANALQNLLTEEIYNVHHEVIVWDSDRNLHSMKVSIIDICIILEARNCFQFLITNLKQINDLTFALAKTNMSNELENFDIPQTSQSCNIYQFALNATDAYNDDIKYLIDYSQIHKLTQISITKEHIILYYAVMKKFTTLVKLFAYSVKECNAFFKTRIELVDDDFKQYLFGYAGINAISDIKGLDNQPSYFAINSKSISLNSTIPKDGLSHSPIKVLIDNSEFFTLEEIIIFLQKYLPVGIEYSQHLTTNKKYSLIFKFHTETEQMSKTDKDAYNPRIRNHNKSKIIKISNVDDSFHRFKIKQYRALPNHNYFISNSKNNTRCLVQINSYPNYDYSKIIINRIIPNAIKLGMLEESYMRCKPKRNSSKDISKILDDQNGYLFIKYSEIESEIEYNSRPIEWLQFVPNFLDEIIQYTHVYELDASFKLKPYIYIVPQAVVANTGVPLSIFIGSRECTQSYTLVFDNMRETMRDPSSLSKLPFISDHHKGLIKFAENRNIVRYECIRHYFNRLGAGTTLQKWAKRVIFSKNEETYFRRFNGYNKLISKMKLTTGQINAWEELKNIRLFAIYLREDKITCSNHCESFHGKFNQLCNGINNMCEKIKVLFTYFNTRLNAITRPRNQALLREYDRLMNIEFIHPIDIKENCPFCSEKEIETFRSKFQLSTNLCPHKLKSLARSSIPYPAIIPNIDNIIQNDTGLTIITKNTSCGEPIIREKGKGKCRAEECEKNDLFSKNEIAPQFKELTINFMITFEISALQALNLIATKNYSSRLNQFHASMVKSDEFYNCMMQCLEEEMDSRK